MNILRRKSFWLLDTIKGEPIKNHFREIETILEDPFCPMAIEQRKVNLRHILTHATATTPFYKQYQGVFELQDFPVISKQEIQDNFEAFKSENYTNQPLFKVSTSGSTGVPFILFHDKLKRRRNSSDVLYFSKHSGYTIGNQLIELEVWRRHNTRSSLKNFLQNTTQFDISKLTEERIRQFLKLLSMDSGPKNLLGFPSAMESICHYVDTSCSLPNIKGLKSVIANSEYLNDYTRKSVQNFFKCPIYSRYSSEELGILAHQTALSGTDFLINWASYHLEILDLKKDVPAKDGDLGRLVITDLFNHSMPLIRYDTGDVARFSKSDKRFLQAVEGRRMDIVFDTQGNVLSSYVVYTKFYPYYHLLSQYQFLQVGEGEYHIKMNLKGDGFNFENELIESVKEDFGKDAKVSIEFVNEIPPLSSGKRKKVVNLYRPY